MKELAIKVLGAAARVVAAVVGLALLLGWLTAIVWNHFDFLVALHHMSLWDGFLLHLLGGLLFKNTSTK